MNISRFIKNDIKKIENSKVDYSKIITYYRRKLVDYGVIRELKNSYKSLSFIKEISYIFSA